MADSLLRELTWVVLRVHRAMELMRRTAVHRCWFDDADHGVLVPA